MFSIIISFLARPTSHQFKKKPTRNGRRGKERGGKKEKKENKQTVTSGSSQLSVCPREDREDQRWLPDLLVVGGPEVGRTRVAELIASAAAEAPDGSRTHIAALEGMESRRRKTPEKSSPWARTPSPTTFLQRLSEKERTELMADIERLKERGDGSGRDDVGPSDAVAGDKGLDGSRGSSSKASARGMGGNALAKAGDGDGDGDVPAWNVRRLTHGEDEAD